MKCPFILSLPAIIAMGVTTFLPIPLARANEARDVPAAQATLIGPGVYGSCFAVAFHPSDVNTFLTGADVSGFFLTRDGGKSWRVMQGDAAMKHAGPGTRGAWCAAFDPVSPDNIWLGGQIGLFKSEDGGATSRLVQPSMIGSIAIDPSDSNIVYAGNGTGGRLGRVSWAPGMIYKTTDGGKQWQKFYPGEEGKKPAAGRNWTHIAIDPASPFVPGEGHQRIFALEYDELWVSEDAGRSWNSLSRYTPGAEEGARLMSDFVLIPSKEGNSILIASYRLKKSVRGAGFIGGVYRSDDHGRTWQGLNEGLEEEFPRIVDSQWVHSTLGHSPAAPERLYWGTALNVYRSDNLGKSWQKLMNQALDSDWIAGWANDRLSPLWSIGRKVELASRSIADEPKDTWRLWRSDSNFKKAFYGFVWAGNDMAVSPINADYLLCGGSAIRLTSDGGKTWDEPMFEYGEAYKPGKFGERPPLLYTHKVRSTGAQVIVPNRVAVDPVDPDTLAVAYMDYGLYISRDDGRWWEWGWEGMKGSFARLLARSVTYDPSVPGRLYMTGGKYGTTGRTPYRSDDGGKTFTPLTIPQVLQWDRSEPKLVHCMDLIIDPSSPPEARTLYVATTVGLFKSTDGGVQWREIGRDLHRSLFLASWINEGPRCLVLHPNNPQILYFFSNGRTSKNNATNAAGVYMSDDGGETWLRLAREQIGSVASFSQSQSHPENLYVVAAAPGTASIGVSTSTRLWHSADSGRTWEPMKTPSAHLTGAYVHPQNPALLYLLTHTIKDPANEPTALFRSRNQGATWELLHAPGLTISLSPFASNGITFSPHDARRLFLLTSAGVWDIIDPLAK